MGYLIDTDHARFRQIYWYFDPKHVWSVELKRSANQPIVWNMNKLGSTDWEVPSHSQTCSTRHSRASDWLTCKWSQNERFINHMRWLLGRWQQKNGKEQEERKTGEKWKGKGEWRHWELDRFRHKAGNGGKNYNKFSQFIVFMTTTWWLDGHWWIHKGSINQNMHYLGLSLEKIKKHHHGWLWTISNKC